MIFDRPSRLKDIKVQQMEPTFTIIFPDSGEIGVDVDYVLGAGPRLIFDIPTPEGEDRYVGMTSPIYDPRTRSLKCVPYGTVQDFLKHSDLKVVVETDFESGIIYIALGIKDSSARIRFVARNALAFHKMSMIKVLEEIEELGDENGSGGFSLFGC